MNQRTNGKILVLAALFYPATFLGLAIGTIYTRN